VPKKEVENAVLESQEEQETDEQEQEEEVTQEELEEEDFTERRDKLVARMQTDPLMRDKMLAELYIYMNAMDTFARRMQASGGIGGLMKMMLGRG
jgi:hypothetical protein